MKVMFKIVGPALDDETLKVERMVSEADFPAWRIAGYEKGSLEGEAKKASDAYWKQKESDLAAELKEAEKAAKAEEKKK